MKKVFEGKACHPYDQGSTTSIIIRSKQRNKFLEGKNEQSRNHYRKQRNLCVALGRRAKQE